MTTTIFAALLAGTILALAAIAFLLARRRAAYRERARFIDQYRFPDELRRRLSQGRPLLTPKQLDLVLTGLRQYFLACLAAQHRPIAKQVGMPSKAVDDAWHEFIVMTREYADFCTKAFGRYLHHTPAAQMPEPVDDAVANTLHQLKSPLIGPASVAMLGTMPLIFALDRELGIADGYRYDPIAMEELDARRRSMVASQSADGSSGAIYAGHSSCDSGSAGCGDSGGGGGSCGGGGGCGGGG